jgi:hypothetical protein
LAELRFLGDFHLVASLHIRESTFLARGLEKDLPTFISTANQRTLRLDLKAEPVVRIAQNREELLAAYRLVHRRYAERGYLGHSTADIVYSKEFASDHSRTLVALSRWGEVTATATIVGEPDDGNVSENAVIPWRLIRSADPQRRLAGVTCLAAADSAVGPKPAAFFGLTRFLFQYARFRNYDGLAIAIHPRQVRFYGRICPIVPLSPVYRQDKLGGSLAVACRIDLDKKSLRRVPPSVLSWFESPISPHELGRPGISPLCNAFLSRYADIAD